MPVEAGAQNGVQHEEVFPGTLERTRIDLPVKMPVELSEIHPWRACVEAVEEQTVLDGGDGVEVLGLTIAGEFVHLCGIESGKGEVGGGEAANPCQTQCRTGGRTHPQ